MPKYELYKGRPETNEGRLEKEIRCYDLLDSLGMEYWRTDHPDAEAYTMEACKEIKDAFGKLLEAMHHEMTVVKLVGEERQAE